MDERLVVSLGRYFQAMVEHYLRSRRSFVHWPEEEVVVPEPEPDKDQELVQLEVVVEEAEEEEEAVAEVVAAVDAIYHVVDTIQQLMFATDRKRLLLPID